MSASDTKLAQAIEEAHLRWIATTTAQYMMDGESYAVAVYRAIERTSGMLADLVEQREDWAKDVVEELGGQVYSAGRKRASA